MHRRCSVVLAVLGAFAMLPSAAHAQDAGLGAAGELVDPDILRVCADPSNMPFSDENGTGFENKLAELVAAKTGRKSVAYTWYPIGHGFRAQHAARQSLRRHHRLSAGR